MAYLHPELLLPPDDPVANKDTTLATPDSTIPSPDSELSIDDLSCPICGTTHSYHYCSTTTTTAAFPDLSRPVNMKSLFKLGLFGTCSQDNETFKLLQQFCLDTDYCLETYKPTEAQLDAITTDLIDLLGAGPRRYLFAYSILINFSKHAYLRQLLLKHPELFPITANHFEVAFKFYYLPSAGNDFRIHFHRLMHHTLTLLYHLTCYPNDAPTAITLPSLTLDLTKQLSTLLKDYTIVEDRPTQLKIQAMLRQYSKSEASTPAASPDTVTGTTPEISPRFASPALAAAFGGMVTTPRLLTSAGSALLDRS